MKNTFLFLATMLFLFSCSNESESNLWGETESSNATTRAGYRGVNGNLYITNSLEVATRLTWEISSIDFIEDDIVSSVQEDYIHTDFSGTTNLPAGNMLNKVLIGSSYQINLKSTHVDKININIYSLYAGPSSNINEEVKFGIRVDIKGNLSSNTLASTYHITGPTHDQILAIPVDMSNVIDQDDYTIEIYIKADTFQDTGIVTDIEGNEYTYRKFGDAGYWMTQNLRSKTYSDGTVLSEIGRLSNDTVAAYYYPNYDTDILSVHPEYGLLYTWSAATKSRKQTSDEENLPTQPQVQGICPDGWHLPSDYEWSELEKAIVSDPLEYSTISDVAAWNDEWRTTISTRGTHGQAMRSATPVDGFTTTGYSKPAISGSGGFDALNVGRVYYGEAKSYGSMAYFWSSSSHSRSTDAWYRIVYSYSAEIGRVYYYRSSMYSVRCKRDE